MSCAAHLSGYAAQPSLGREPRKKHKQKTNDHSLPSMPGITLPFKGFGNISQVTTPGPPS